MNAKSTFYTALALVAILTAPFVQGYTFYDPVIKWPTATATSTGDIKLFGDASSDSSTTWNTAYAQAASNWTNNTVFTLNTNMGRASHPCAGYPGFPQYPEDRLNGVDFFDTACDDNFGNSTLAITISFFDPSTGETQESDIIFNNDVLWDVYDGNQRGNVFDFRRVALHELGHFQGLSHETSQPAIMQPVINNNASLLADDIAGILALYGDNVEPPGLDPIVMRIESPVASDIKAGVSSVQGWVVSLSPLVSVKYYENNVFKKDLVATGTRNDVGNAFPEYPGSANSGFAFAQNWGLLGVGRHTIRVDARDNQGNTLSQSVSFTVDAFDNIFVQDTQVSMNGATVSKSGTDVIISNFLHDGIRYRVTMRWNKQAQSFVIIGITRN